MLIWAEDCFLGGSAPRVVVFYLIPLRCIIHFVGGLLWRFWPVILDRGVGCLVAGPGSLTLFAAKDAAKINRSFHCT